jgi:hypothetical protein
LFELAFRFEGDLVVAIHHQNTVSQLSFALVVADAIVEGAHEDDHHSGNSDTDGDSNDGVIVRVAIKLLVFSVHSVGLISQPGLPVHSAVSGVPSLQELAVIVSTRDCLSENNLGINSTEDRLLVINADEEVITCVQLEVSRSLKTSGESSVLINLHRDLIFLKGYWLNEGVFNFVSSGVVKLFEGIGRNVL